MDFALLDRWKENIIQEASLGTQQPDLIIQAFQRINHYHDLMHRSIMESCERSLIEHQTALPSFTYCWIEMGSGGRKERTLWTDQDNGIIYQAEG